MGGYTKISNAYSKMIDPNAVKSVFFGGEYPARVVLNGLKFDLVYNGESPTYRSMSRDSCSAIFLRLSKVDSFTYSIWCQMVIQYGPNIHMDPVEANMDAKEVSKQSDPFDWAVNSILMPAAKNEFTDYQKKIEEWNRTPAMHGRLVKAGELGLKMLKAFVK